MDENGYYDSDDLWSELSNKEKRERLVGAGFELVIDSDTIWSLLSSENKKKVLSSSNETSGFVDLNKVNLDILVDNLHNEIMFRSDSQAFVIGKLIDFYNKNKDRYKHISKRPEIER